MSRLSRRNKTKRIRFWKKRGYAFKDGSFWKKFRWVLPVEVMSGDEIKDRLMAIKAEWNVFIPDEK